MLLVIMHAEAVDTPNRCPISRYELLVANLQMHSAILLSIAMHFPVECLSWKNMVLIRHIAL